MATSENMQQDQDDFAAAFNGEEPQSNVQTEDEVFGLGEQESEPQEAEEGESATAGESGEDEAPAVVIAIEPGAEDNEGAEDMPTDPKEIQRQKSWEGRLKAREADLKAREDALKTPDPREPEETPAQDAAEPAVTEAVEEAVAAVESGEMTVDQAMKTLANDFGDDFTKMLGFLIESKASEIAGKAADDRMSVVKRDVDGIVNEIVDDKARSHFEIISDAHPDFMDVAESPEFKGYVDSLDETQQAKAQKIIESGSARQIVRLLSDYKASGNKVDPVEDPAMDAAEGVRSKGLKIPEKPAQSEDYEAAWSQF